MFIVRATIGRACSLGHLERSVRILVKDERGAFGIDEHGTGATLGAGRRGRT